MNEHLPTLIRIAGAAQLAILIASALVPFRLNWREEFAPLSRLHRQMYWVYGGYVVLSIVAFAVISLLHAQELAAGGGLARAFATYVAIFWGVRLALQGVLDARPYLTHWWLRAGYHLLTFVFVGLTLTYAWVAVHW